MTYAHKEKSLAAGSRQTLRSAHFSSYSVARLPEGLHNRVQRIPHSKQTLHILEKKRLWLGRTQNPYDL